MGQVLSEDPDLELVEKFSEKFCQPKSCDGIYLGHLSRIFKKVPLPLA